RKLVRRTVSPRVQVKAAGGVRPLDALLAVMDLGVTRCGATATAAVLGDFRGPAARAGGPRVCVAALASSARRPRRGGAAAPAVILDGSRARAAGAVPAAAAA